MSFARRLGAALCSAGRWLATRIGRGLLLRPSPPAPALPPGTALSALAGAAERGLAESLLRLDRRLPAEVAMAARIARLRVPVLYLGSEPAAPRLPAAPFRPVVWLRPAAGDGGRIRRGGPRRRAGRSRPRED